MAGSHENQVGVEAATACLVEGAAQHRQVLAWVVAPYIEEVRTADLEPVQHLRHSRRVLRAHPRVDAGVDDGDPAAGNAIEAGEVIGGRPAGPGQKNWAAAPRAGRRLPGPPRRAAGR